jgi:arylsulfatase A-like enzyme
VFWEIGRQTAVRRGRWKLVLSGQLVEGMPPADDVFLADLETDPAETRNLRDEHPSLVGELRAAAESWRQGIERRWDRQWKPQLEAVGATGHE